MSENAHLRYMIRLDVFDAIGPGEQEWLEFRTAFAAGRLQAWLIAGLSDIAPDFFESLEARFDQAEGEAEDRQAETPDHDWAEIELPGGVTWVADRSDMAEVRNQILPHHHTQEEFPYRARCLALVAMHSALEGFCASIDVNTRGRLPDNVRERLALTVGLSESEYRQFVECDALRHLIVHTRGIVDAKFKERVPWSGLTLGERHPLSDRSLWEKGDALWQVASYLRALS